MAKPPKPTHLTRKHLARVERERRQRRWLLIGVTAVIVIVIGVIAYGFAFNAFIMGNQPVARIGNTAISTHDWQVRVRYQRYTLINQYAQYYQIYSSVGMDPTTQPALNQIQAELNDPTTLGGQVLDLMIDDIAIRDQAASLGVIVTPQEIDQAMQNAFGYFPNGTPTPTITSTPWLTPTLNPTELFLVTPTPTATPTPVPTATATPKSSPTPSPAPSVTPTAGPIPTNTPFTQAGYQAAVQNFLTNAAKQGVTGIGEADLRKIFEAQVYRQKVEAKVTANSPGVQDQVWARHMVLPTQAAAQAAIARLKTGQDWTKVTSEVSTDTATKTTGGDLGWFPKGIQDPALEKAAFALPVGQVSDPVQTKAGWEVIQVLGHATRPIDTATLQQLQNAAFQGWLTSAKAKINITKYDYWTQRVPAEPTLNPGSPAAPGG